MPYTQAKSLDDTVKSALTRKQQLLSDRVSTGSDSALYYFTNRTPWIKMTSAVDVVGKPQQQEFSLEEAEASQLAQDYILTSQYEQSGIPSGHSNTSLGIRPRPGILNMHVVAHNQFGSLRTAKVSFQVWSKEDLDACETLYMRPGMSVLLEWGWSLYLDSTGDSITVHPTKKGYDLFGKNGHTVPNSLIGILKELNQLKENNGHGYDAIFGFVKNFSWKLRADGGYDCSTDIVSPGEIIESLNIAQPVSDLDAKYYNEYKQSILDTRAAELSQAVADPNLNESSWEKFVNRYLVPASGYITTTGLYGKVQSGNFGWDSAQTAAVSRAAEATRIKIIKELQSTIEQVPSYESQTALSTFFEVDLKLVAISDIESKLKKRSLNKSYAQPSVVDFDLTTLTVGRYISRLFETNSDLLEEYKWLRYIGWKTQEYKKNSEGELVMQNGEPVVQEKTNPLYYVKYGLVLELMNRFMLHNAGKPIVSFDASRSLKFNDRAADLFSLDPASCILPGDMEYVEEGYKVFEITHDTDHVFPPTSKKASLRNTITDIYLSVDFLADLISASGLKTFTGDGVPQIRLFQFIEAINAKINQACAGALELSIQYYEDEAKFAILDRVNFDEISKEEFNYKLTAIGSGSICRDISVDSSLTPEMASSLAISVQGDYKARNNTEAGFLRFNEGLQDRVLTNRATTGLFSNTTPEDLYNTSAITSEDLSQVETLYNAVYGTLSWLPAAFTYAREIHHKYVTEILNQSTSDIPANGRTVIPFITSFTLDGTSGVKILNSLLLDNNLLPYSYNKIKGGVGVLITGVEASVDPSGWWTTLKGQYYARKSGTYAQVKAKLRARLEEKNAQPSDHILYNYSDRLGELDITNYQSDEGIVKVTRRSTTTEIPSYFEELHDIIVRHQETYWIAPNTIEGLITEGEFLPESLEYTLSTAGDLPQSPLKLYWEYADPTGALYGSYGPNTHKISWSAVYVSYMITNLQSRLPRSAFKPRTAHYLYVLDGLKALEKGESAKWVAFSLEYYGNIIQVEVGDVVVWPTNTDLKDSATGLSAGSHGVIIHKVDIDNKLAYRAGGNESLGASNAGKYNTIDKTFKIQTTTITDSKGVVKTIPIYGKAEKGISKRLIVLKYIQTIR